MVENTKSKINCNIKNLIKIFNFNLSNSNVYLELSKNEIKAPTIKPEAPEKKGFIFEILFKKMTTMKLAKLFIIPTIANFIIFNFKK